MNKLEVYAEYDNPEVEAALVKATGAVIKEFDYANWLDTQDQAAYKRFDKAVRSYLGDRLYKVAEDAARLDLMLRVCLGVKLDDPKFEIDYVRELRAAAAEPDVPKIVTVQNVYIRKGVVQAVTFWNHDGYFLCKTKGVNAVCVSFDVVAKTWVGYSITHAHSLRCAKKTAAEAFASIVRKAWRPSYNV